MKVVGLTGGIGSGKSTVARMFQELGVPIYFADTEAKKLMNSSDMLKKSIENLFGSEAYVNGTLNRPFIATIVFKDKEQLNNLNKLVHPAVREHFLNWIKEQQAAYVIQENALIFDKNVQDEYDILITVTADKEKRIDRVMARDGILRSQVLDRMNNQIEDELRIVGSDYVITNNSLDKTRTQVLDLHEELLNQIP